MEWAAANVTSLDGRLLREGVDIEALLAGPVRRFVAVMYSLYVEQVSWVKDEKERGELLAIVEWPEVTERDDVAASDRQARAAMAQLGIRVDFDAAARARAAAMADGDPDPGNNDPVHEGTDG